MRPPKNARYVVVRTPAVTDATLRAPRIAVVIGDKVHIKLGGGSLQSWHRHGHPLASVEIVRDATPREVAVGMMLH